MNKKILVAILALSLMQAPQAQAGFFNFFRTQIAAIGLALASIFRSRTPPRVTSDDTTPVVSPLADDPNNYQVSTELVEQPSTADCFPTTTAHRCSDSESAQVASSSCVNPVAVKTGSTNGTGRTGN